MWQEGHADDVTNLGVTLVIITHTTEGHLVGEVVEGMASLPGVRNVTALVPVIE